MRETFQVLTDGWIPVVDLDGNQRKLGILETLEKAHTLREISDASAMVEYSLYRFLSVFLMDALRPEEIGDLEDLLEEGEFPKDVLEGYVQLCREEGVSFDLFDPQRPFLQTPYCEKWDKQEKPVGALNYTLPSGNNHVHFDHRNPQAVTMEYDEAARYLLCAQLFCTSGAQGYPSNVYASPPYFTVVKGRNLFETLVYSLFPINRIDVLDEPPVIWRNKTPVEPKKEVVRTSWLYGMLFPTRRILLIPNDGKVSRVYYSQGLNYTAKENWVDPFATYLQGKTGISPWRPKMEKAVWRNLSDLVDVRGKSAPQVLRQYFEMEKESEEASISLYGVQTSQASYLNMVHIDLKIPAYLTKDEDYIRYMRDCVSAAEICASGLRKSFADNPDITETMVSQAVQEYYDLCEGAFWQFCRNDMEACSDLNAVYEGWCQELIRMVKSVRERVLASVRLNGHALAKAAEMEKEIAFAAKKIKRGSLNG